MKITNNKKILVYGIIILFIGAAFLPSITGNIEKNLINLTKESSTSMLLNNNYVNSYWKFDECSGDTVGDSSVHNYDGTRYGATWTTDGYSGCALVFDGVDDYVDLTSYAADIMINKTDDVIFSFYFKSTGKGIIFSATAPWGNNPEFKIELVSNGTLLFYKITQLCGIILYSNSTYNDGEWHHAEYYYNGILSSPSVILYVDDKFDSNVTHYLCEIENDDYAKTMIGMHAHSSTNNYDGYIDEFKFIKYEGGNEQKPPTISGPIGGEPNVEYTYTFVTDDPEEDDIWILIDWDDGTEEDWRGPYASGEAVTVTHKWTVEGNYCVKAKSMDIWDDSRWSDCYEVKIGNQPPDPPTINGPRCGDPGEEITYTFVTEDFEGHDVFYYVDWGDGTFDNWFGPFSSGQVTTASHSWDTEGDYEIKAKAKDDLGSEGDWSNYSIKIGNQSPPEAPDIDGPKKGQARVFYGYLFVTTDPDGDRIIYEISWGDGTSDERGPYLSGEETVVNHAWESPGIYTIKARARDEFCGENSDWSEYEVNIPRNRAIKIDLIEWMFKRFLNISLITKFLLDYKYNI